MSKKKASKNVRVALFHIFSYLDTNELLKVALVSKQWCKISRHPALWKNISLHNRSISSEVRAVQTDQIALPFVYCEDFVWHCFSPVNSVH